MARAAYALYVPRMDREPAPMVADYATIAEQGDAWVAVRGDSLLGFLVLALADDHMLVDTVAVAPEAQGLGIGGLLLGLAEQRARAAGLRELRLYTNEAMTENLGYYRRRGYLETHRATDDGFRRVFFSKLIAIDADAGGMP